MNLNDVVYDSWWPLRLGSVVRCLKTRIRVQWSDGEVWSYDKAHQKFLRLHHTPTPRRKRLRGVRKSR